MSQLGVRGLRVVLGDRAVLEDIDFDLAPGKVTLLAGRNGSGKTTLLNALGGVLAPDAGEVTLDGQPLRAVHPRQRARAMTMIPQDTDASFEFTGRELVMMGRHPHIPRMGLPGPDDHRAVDRALELADAVAFADRSITTLSGGERQRITIARALATEADILLADEPTANLDLDHALATFDLFRGLAAEGKTVLLVSHDLNLAAPCADLTALLHEGHVHSMGPPQEALSPEAMADVFAVWSGEPSGYFPRAFCKLR